MFGPKRREEEIRSFSTVYLMMFGGALVVCSAVVGNAVLGSNQFQGFGVLIHPTPMTRDVRLCLPSLFANTEYSYLHIF